MCVCVHKHAIIKSVWAYGVWTVEMAAGIYEASHPHRQAHTAVPRLPVFQDSYECRLAHLKITMPCYKVKDHSTPKPQRPWDLASGQHSQEVRAFFPLFFPGTWDRVTSLFLRHSFHNCWLLLSRANNLLLCWPAMGWACFTWLDASCAEGWSPFWWYGNGGIWKRGTWWGVIMS